MPAYNRQLKDEDGNIIYPIINDGSLQNNSVTTGKIADGAVTESKIDWTESPCVSTFVLSGSAMPVSGNDQHIDVTTKRGTQLTLALSHNACYIYSGADDIHRVRYTINYRHPNVTSNYGVTGLSTNSYIYTYYVGMNVGSAVNSSATNSTNTNVFGTLMPTSGDKIVFATVFDAIRVSNDTNYDRRKMWNLIGQIISAGSATSYMVNAEVTATNTDTVPSWYQSNVTGTYHYIAIDVYED